MVSHGQVLLKPSPEELYKEKCHLDLLDYINLHNSVYHSPQVKYVVFKPVGGLADRFTGMVTGFLYALLKNRVFYLDWPGFEHAFRPLSITVSPPSHLILGKKADAMLSKKDVSIYFQHRLDAEKVIYLSGNRGNVYQILTHPNFKKRCKAFGLQQNTAFACIFNFLVQPTDAIRDAYMWLRQEVLATSSISIGIQIRTFQLKKNTISSKNVSEDSGISVSTSFIKCAQEIEDSRSGKKNTTWLIISDSSSLRASIRDQFKFKKILSPNISQSSLSSNWWGQQPGDTPDTELSLSPFQQSVGELWLFSHCDYYVYTSKSGYGRVGGVSGLKADRLYPIGPRKDSRNVRSCTKGGSRISQVSLTSAGL
mmetsp:Transcript_5219/g.17359  ORF Transcript_5219/g.17359 Transcript_5219/m.17359 type:complete len:367 (+) Transcript_5219:320-1420(+)